jgi:hypothetical protein
LQLSKFDIVLHYHLTITTMKNRFTFTSLKDYNAAIEEICNERNYGNSIDKMGRLYFECNWNIAKVFTNFLNWKNIPFVLEDVENPWDKIVHTYQK